ncbi:MAG: NAD(P)H-dependent oxidoreductase subunit E [Bacteroidota bacterium]
MGNTYDTRTKEVTAKIPFPQDLLDKIEEITKRYPAGKQKSALIPVLHIAQKQNEGWLSIPVMDYVAGLLHITPIEVYEVATFYTMFNLKPVGKFVLEVCRTGPCCTRGAEKMIEYIEQKTNCKVGANSADGLFTIKAVECLGACGYAPMLQLGDSFVEFLTEEKVDSLINELKNK